MVRELSGSAVGAVIAAIRSLTILPIGAPRGDRPFGAAAFPVVGFGIGLTVAAADAVFAAIPFELRNIGVVAFLAVLTGGLHYDGLADTLDAERGHTPEERLRYMKERAIGSFGVLGLMLALATKISSLMLLGDPTRFPALVLAPALARFAMVIAGYRAATAHPDDRSAALVASLGPADLGIAAGFALVVSMMMSGWFGFLAVLLTAGIAIAVRAWATHRFGGVTPDVIAAVSEISETFLLAFFAATRMGA